MHDGQSLGRPGEGDVEGAQPLRGLAAIRAGSTTVTESNSSPLASSMANRVTCSSRAPIAHPAVRQTRRIQARGDRVEQRRRHDHPGRAGEPPPRSR
jgi:hypothetical protein